MGILSSHLAPYKENALVRFNQVKALCQTFASTSSTTTIHAGDFNMRQAEEDAIEGLGLLDAWKEAGKQFKHQNTWNSIENNYHASGYPFKCRFDCIYVSKQGGSSHVTDFVLMATKPLMSNKKEFYLSDHYGMLCTIQASNEE